MPASLVKQYYDALADGRLSADRCGACGTIAFPRTGCCESCGSSDGHEMVLAGTGTLLFASHNGPQACHPRFAPYAPYVYGHVVLDEGVYTQGMIVGVPGTPEAVAALYERLPLRVRATIVRTEDLPVLGFEVVA